MNYHNHRRPYNAKASISGLELFLDIDSAKETVKDCFYEGELALEFKDELDELKALVLGQKIYQLKKITRQQLKREKLLANDFLRVSPLGLGLLKTALSAYLGESRTFYEQNDLLCLCFTVTRNDIVKKILEEKDFDLKVLIQTTMATSACGSCRTSIEKLMVDTRNEFGLIEGMDHSRSRFDKNGQWVKVAGLYPGPLLIKIEELKNEWMDRENIREQFDLQLMHIEGHHIDIKISACNKKLSETISDKVQDGLLVALSEYLKSELKVLFFLQKF